MKISAKKVVSYVKPQLSVKSAFVALTGSSLAAEALARVGGQLKKKMFGHQHPVEVEPTYIPQVVVVEFEPTYIPQVVVESDADRDARIDKLSGVTGQHGLDASHLKQIKDEKFWCSGLAEFESAINAYHQADENFRKLSQTEDCNAFEFNTAKKDRDSRRTAMEQEFKRLARYFYVHDSLESQSSLIQQHLAECAKLPSTKGAVGSTDEQKNAVSVSSQPVSSQPVSSQPVSSQPVSSQPVSSQPVSSVATQPTNVDSLESMDQWLVEFDAEMAKI